MIDVCLVEVIAADNVVVYFDDDYLKYEMSFEETRSINTLRWKDRCRS